MMCCRRYSGVTGSAMSGRLCTRVAPGDQPPGVTWLCYTSRGYSRRALWCIMCHSIQIRVALWASTSSSGSRTSSTCQVPSLLPLSCDSIITQTCGTPLTQLAMSAVCMAANFAALCLLAISQVQQQLMVLLGSAGQCELYPPSRLKQHSRLPAWRRYPVLPQQDTLTPTRMLPAGLHADGQEEFEDQNRSVCS